MKKLFPLLIFALALPFVGLGQGAPPGSVTQNNYDANIFGTVCNLVGSFTVLTSNSITLGSSTGILLNGPVFPSLPESVTLMQPEMMNSLTAMFQATAYQTNTAYLDTINGNDSTGAIGSNSFPFQTFTAAYNSLPQSNGVIWVTPQSSVLFNTNGPFTLSKSLAIVGGISNASVLPSFQNTLNTDTGFNISTNNLTVIGIDFTNFVINPVMMTGCNPSIWVQFCRFDNFGSIDCIRANKSGAPSGYNMQVEVDNCLLHSGGDIFNDTSSSLFIGGNSSVVFNNCVMNTTNSFGRLFFKFQSPAICELNNCFISLNVLPGNAGGASDLSSIIASGGTQLILDNDFIVNTSSNVIVPRVIIQNAGTTLTMRKMITPVDVSNADGLATTNTIASEYRLIQLEQGILPPAASFPMVNSTTNGYFVGLATNNTPAIAAPNGSLCVTTNGQFYVMSNQSWVLH